MTLKCVRLEAALVCIAAMADYTCMLPVGCFFHLVIMVTQVMLQIGQLSKLAVTFTQGAFVWLFTSVYTVMLLKVTQLLEGLITITAMVLPSSAVYKVVLDQLLFTFKTLEASWTGKLAVHFINVLLILCH